MSGQAERQAADLRGPLWSQIANIATSNVVATQDLNKVGDQTTATQSGNSKPGCVGKFIRIKVVTTDVWIVFADTAAHAANVTANTAGVNATTGGYLISANTWEDFFVTSAAPFLGFITASGTGNILIFPASGT